MKLEPWRIEDVPVPELSGLALAATADGLPQLFAIGDRKSVLARAALTDEPLEWALLDLDRAGPSRDRQFEAITATADGTLLVLCEDPPLVLVLQPDAGRAETIALAPGDHGVLAEIFDESSSSGEGLVPLRAGHLLVAKEKDPPLLVEFGPRGAEAAGVQTDSFLVGEGGLVPDDGGLHALAAWKLDGVDDISDLAFAGGALYCLSDQSRRVVVVDLPLDPDADRARIGEGWDLRVPERRDEPEGKPEGLVVTDDGTLIVGLDTEKPQANLCWYQP